MARRRTPPPSAPVRADGWLTPAGGFNPQRDPWALVLNSSFDGKPAAALGIFHRVIEALVKVVGDPRARARFLVNKPGVPRLIGSWDDHRSAARPSEWLRDRAFDQLRGVPWFSLSAFASRGGGAFKHTVWDLDLHDSRPHKLGFVLTLAIDARYLNLEHAKETARLIENFFEACSRDVQTLYGYGRLAHAGQERNLVLFGDGGQHIDTSIVLEPFRDLPASEYVPWVYPVNHLSLEHVRRLGGMAAIQSQLKDATRRYDFEFPAAREQPNGSLVLTLAELRESFSSISWVTETEVAHRAAWLFNLFLGAGMVAFQHDAWLKTREKRVAEHRNAPPLVADPAAERAARKAWKQACAELLKKLRLSPPRCAAGCSRPAPMRGKPRGELQTCFDLVHSTHTPGTTVYGRVSRHTPTLLPPIRLGSPSPAKAWFEFDPARDGFNGEQGLTDPIPGSMNSLVCPRCSGRHFACSIELSYSEELLDIPDMAARPQDFFDWFVLVTRCASCSARRTAAEWECA